MSIKFQSSIQQAEGTLKYVILDIGAGETPIYLRSEAVMEKIKNGARYVGLDVDREELRKGLDGRDSILGDFSRLPLKEDSADEIWIMNIFGGDLTRSDGSLDYYRVDMGRYFDELIRVLRPRGVIHIGELYTPIRPVDWVVNTDYNSLGLEKGVYAGERTVEFLREHRMHPEGAIFGSDSPFFVTLRRTYNKK